MEQVNQLGEVRVRERGRNGKDNAVNGIHATIQWGSLKAGCCKP